MTSQNDSHSLAGAMVEHLRNEYNDDEAFRRENDPDEIFERFFFWQEDGHGDDEDDSAILLTMWELY